MSIRNEASWRWPLITGFIAVPIALPIVSILTKGFLADTGYWQHLRATVLSDYLANTLGLMLLVGLLAAFIGITGAWLTATRRFPGSRYFSWLLILPFAAPAYVVAYAYADLLEFAGPLQTGLRELFQTTPEDSYFPAIRSLPGAALVLSFVLYPYIYLTCYAAFTRQSSAYRKAAQSLGASPLRVFFKVSLPVARPAIAAGLALVLMETAADYGVVDFYGVPTFTTGIFRTWFALGEHQAAMQLAATLFGVVALLILFEKFARRGLVANPLSSRVTPEREEMKGLAAWCATLFCSVPVLVGFIIPVLLFISQAISHGDPMLGRAFSNYASNSALVASITAFLAAVAAIALCYASRLDDRWFIRGGLRFATLGYAFPGLVLAVGLMVPLTALDKYLSSLLEINRLVITGSIGGLVMVYLARFLTVAFNSTEAGMEQINPRLDAAARSLGAGPWRLLRRIHLPLISPAIVTGALLVFIDVVKELPATLIMRPFNFETLATRAYRLASDERVAEASSACLCIIALGCIPTIIIGLRLIRGRSL
ncbi:MAG: iron ABC transporter permease [Pseudomonadota bacterium]